MRNTMCQYTYRMIKDASLYDVSRLNNRIPLNGRQFIKALKVMKKLGCTGSLARRSLPIGKLCVRGVWRVLEIFIALPVLFMSKMIGITALQQSRTTAIMRVTKKVSWMVFLSPHLLRWTQCLKRLVLCGYLMATRGAAAIMLACIVIGVCIVNLEAQMKQVAFR